MLDTYRRFLAQPHAASILGASILARVPIGVVPLALILLLRHEGRSYGEAGAVVGAYTAALAVSSPVLGRIMDRRGRRAVLRRLGTLFPLCVFGGIALATLDAPLWLIAFGAAATGAALPPVGSAVRSLWPTLLPAEMRTVAYSVEAAFQEVTFTIGPLLAAGLAWIHPAAALAAGAVLAALGTALVLHQPPMRNEPAPSERQAGRLGALGSAGVRTLIVVCFALGASVGAIELAMPAFAEQHGHRALGGLSIAALAFGSMVGGFLTGALHGVSPRVRLAAAVACLAPCLALLQLADSIPMLIGLSFAAGLPFAPIIAGCYAIVDQVGIVGTAVESFAWLGTAITAGLAVGTAAGGLIVDATGVSATIWLGVAAAAAAALVTVARRPTLRPPASFAAVV